MKLSNKDLNTISLHCHAVVCNLFAMMCNEKYRGPKFQWNEFHELASSRCEDQVWLNAPISKTKMKLAKKQAIIVGEAITKRMVKSAGF